MSQHMTTMITAGRDEGWVKVTDDWCYHCTATLARLHGCTLALPRASFPPFTSLMWKHALQFKSKSGTESEMPWNHYCTTTPTHTWIHHNPVTTLPSNSAKTTQVHRCREISTHTKHLVQWNCPTVPQVTSMLHSPLLSQQTPSLGGRLVTLGRWDGRGEARALNGAVGSVWKAEVSETWVSGSGLLGLSCCVTSGSDQRLTDWKRKETSRAPSMPVYFCLFIWFHLPQPSGIFLC